MIHLLKGEIEKFEHDLQEVLLQTVSVHDTAKQPEAFYHGLILGLAASLDPKQYEIRSNREGGYGRYDIGIIAKNSENASVLLELKSAANAQDLENAAQAALQQIEERQYIAELQQRGQQKIIKIGLSFPSKQFCLRHG